MERLLTASVERDGAEPVLLCSNTYDLNGNMTRDLNKGIRSVTYNTLNLPQSVLFTDGHITRYTYAADGRKLRVEHLLSNFTITDPVGRLSGHAGGSGASTMSFGGEESPLPLDSVALPPAETTLMVRDYCGNHIYRNGVLERVLNDVGYADSTGYHYQVKDYRGDVRAVVAQNGTLEETNSYYPYGMLHGTSAIASTQPYKYTGKELDRENGLDWYDFHARMLMSDQGRTTTMDPLAEKYYCISPYMWCAGNPVKFVDPEGEKVIVKQEYQEQFKDAMFAIFGNFSHLFSFNGNELSLPTDKQPKGKKQKTLYNALKQITSSDVITNIYYADYVEVTNVLGENKTISTIEHGGEATLSIIEHPDFEENHIVVSPNPNPSIPVLEILPNYYDCITEKGFISNGKESFKEVYIQTNKVDLLWHGLGHVIFAGEKQYKVIDFNNIARKIIGLKPRRLDQFHNIIKENFK